MLDFLEENSLAPSFGPPLANRVVSEILPLRMPLPAEITWSPPPPNWLAAWRVGTPSEAHVWAVSLNAPPATLETLESYLSVSEQERASRFHFPLHRDRFIAGRGWLRALLG